MLITLSFFFFFFFFFNDTATTEIYTLSLHDALPICGFGDAEIDHLWHGYAIIDGDENVRRFDIARSEEHTSELQSQSNLVCRLLLEKKKKCHRQNIIGLVNWECAREYQI